MARNNLVNLREYRGWPHALAFVAKTAVVLHASPGRRRPGCGSAPAPCAPALRGDFTGHRRFLRELSPAETVAVVVVTYNRADLLGRMLDGLAAQTRAPGRRDRRRQRQHRPHPRGARRRTDLAAAASSTREENIGGAGGFHLGVRGGVRRRASTGSG